MIFSKQKWFCNCCGKEQLSVMANGTNCMGRDWKTCSVECLKEIQWRETLSIMNKEYRELK